MRHLRVPSAETQHWVEFCRTNGWLQLGAGVITLNDGWKGIPVLDIAPLAGEECWGKNALFDAEAITRGPAHWSERLDVDVLNKIGQNLPKSHEIQGDLLIVKLEEAIKKHAKAIAEAMLEQFPSTRLICADNGVTGKFRVRQLQPLLSRNNDDTTRTRIRENGVLMWTDPAKAYFSARLSNERAGNLSAAIELKKHLKRPLRLCDPYAGVGPSLSYLLPEEGLISNCYIGDLNPDAFDLLVLNSQNFIAKRNDKTITLFSKNQDARLWKDDGLVKGQIDMLLVNLPHDSINHLPELIPLLAKEQTTVIRGWAIIDKTEVEACQKEIEEILKSAKADIESISCSEVKGFSSSKIFMRFETWQKLP